jgi:hypothetical protein
MVPTVAMDDTRLSPDEHIIFFFLKHTEYATPEAMLFNAIKIMPADTLIDHKEVSTRCV